MPTREETYQQRKAELEVLKTLHRDLLDEEKERKQELEELVHLYEQQLHNIETQLDKAKALTEQYEKLNKTQLGRIAHQNQVVHTLELEKRSIDILIKDQQKMLELVDDEHQDVDAVRQMLLKKLQVLQTNIEYEKMSLELVDSQTASYKEGVDAVADLGKQLMSAFSTKNSARVQGVFAAIVNAGKSVGTIKKGWASAKVEAGEMALATGKAAGGMDLLAIAGKKVLVAMGPLLLLAPLIAFVGEIWNLVFGLDEMEKSLRKGTLASKEYAKAASANYQANMDWGLSMDQAGKGMHEMMFTLTDFTMSTDAEQKSVTDLTTAFQLLGVDAGATNKALQTATASFGMSMPRAVREVQRLTVVASELNLDFGELVNTFGEMGPAMAKFDDVGRTFADLARIAKITGFEMQDILGIVEKFDTFEGAAKQAGKLNAALGGNFVNAMDLMMATNPAERFEMIRDSILNAGLSFGSMSYYQKKFFADAAGLKDVNDLSKLMRGDMDALAGATEKEAKTMDDLKEMGYAMLPIMEQITAALKEVFAKTDTAAMIDGLNRFTAALKGIETMINAVRFVMMIVIALFAVLAIKAAFVTAPIWVLAGAFGVLLTFINDLLGNPIRGLLESLGLVARATTEVTEAANKKKSASFMDMWEVLALSMKVLAGAVDIVLKPLSMLERIIVAIGGISGNIAGMFNALLAPEAAENIMKIGSAIANLPLTKTLAFTTTMLATAGAATAMSAAGVGNRVAALGGNATGAGGGKREQKTYNINLKMPDGTVSKAAVLKIEADNFLEAELSRPRGAGGVR